MSDPNRKPDSTSEKPRFMREERFDEEAPERLLDSRPRQRPLNEQQPPADNKPKVLTS